MLDSSVSKNSCTAFSGVGRKPKSNVRPGRSETRKDPDLVEYIP